MRRSKFLELISAHIDGELSDNEEALLCEEIRKNPGYARILSSYECMNDAARAARFPLRNETIARTYTRRATFAWCLSGSAVGVAAALAIIAAVNRPAHAPVAFDDNDYCVIDCNFSVDSELPASAASKALDISIARDTARSPFTPSKPNIGGNVLSSCAADEKTIRQAEILPHESLQKSMSQSIGSLCIPVSYNP
jgi:hypothetical protein